MKSQTSEVHQLSAETLTLAHRSLVEPMLRALDSPLSEYSFANLFLFRGVHQYAVTFHPLPQILGVTYDGVRHSMPLVEFSKRDVDALLGRASCIYPVTEEIALLGGTFGLTSQSNDDDSDYTYDARRLATLSGKILHPKRIEAASFAAAARPLVETLAPRNRHLAVEILEPWAQQVARPNSDTDYDACSEALANFEALGLHGILISDAAGAPCAFLLAQRLGRRSVAVHFAKGNRNYPGVYPYLFSRFAATCEATSLNFEQDLGKPGLRQAKRALDPLGQLRKYRLSAAAP